MCWTRPALYEKQDQSKTHHSCKASIYILYLTKGFGKGMSVLGFDEVMWASMNNEAHNGRDFVAERNVFITSQFYRKSSRQTCGR